EFAVLLVNTDFDGAVDVAEKIRTGVEGLQIPLSDGAISKMTVSIGINCLIPTQNSVLEDFIRNTDMALYTAKKEGRNRVCKYSSTKII
ncbi:MAG: diguanylate cyclase, partial [Treponema sp.]|nr:diguanylate cyclase [Treponema sp.]